MSIDLSVDASKNQLRLVRTPNDTSLIWFRNFLFFKPLTDLSLVIKEVPSTVIDLNLANPANAVLH